MATYVITVIGDDHVGLVQSLADVVASTGGNWERSEMAELAGKFAGILEVTLPDERAEGLAAVVRGLDNGLTVTIQQATAPATRASAQERVTVDLVADDHPGIVREITTTLSQHGVSIDRLESEVTDAPMMGGRLFRCKATVRAHPDVLTAVQADLEKLAGELMVELKIAANA
jgi:glycine cleavage system regulatory protein